MSETMRGRLLALALQWPILASVLIYLISRLVVLSGVVIGPLVVPLKEMETPRIFAKQGYGLLLQYDSQHYFTIARDGYDSFGAPLLHSNVVFYPLYPMLVRVVSDLTGWLLCDTLLVVANLAGLLAVVVLADLVRREHDNATALLTVSLFSFYPSSLFLSSGYTESLALLFGLAAFSAFRADRIGLAALLIGLMLATRSTGIVMLPILLVAIWQSNRYEIGSTLKDSTVWGSVALSGLLAFMAYLWLAHGDPFIFSTAQDAWNDDMRFDERLLNAVRLTPLYTRFSIGTLHFIGIIAILVVGWNRIKPDLLFFALAAMLLPYFSLAGGSAGLTSMARFSLMAFPAFIILAILLPRKPIVLVPVLAASGLVLLVYSSVFAQSNWIG